MADQKENSMLEHYVSDRKTLGCLRAGPSGPYMDGFAEFLHRAGYRNAGARDYLRTAAHLGQFLLFRKIEIADFEANTREAFLDHFPRCQCAFFQARKADYDTRCGAKRFHEYLLQRKVCRPPSEAEVQVWPELVESFRNWYRQHRGVSERTLDQYLHGASALVEKLGADPSQWDAHQVRSIVLDCAQQKGTSSAQKAVTATRVFLRFLSFRGQCRAGLDQAIPPVAHWKLAALPPCLTADELNRLIAACEGDSPSRRRDRAVVLLLARLGLRAGDVAGLRLTDIEWQSGTMRVSGKGRREVRLPLPQDVGDALLSYLECRPRLGHTERVFVRNIAPFRPGVTSAAISAVVGRALKRADIVARSKGAHLLRHTAATEMLRHDVPLDRIGLVLRHRSLHMTASYAKVDVALLSQVSQPWPEVKS
jgi:site-specific recombinase XerD